MPLECGLALGAILYLPQPRAPRDLFFLSAEPYDDKKTISDLAGLDGGYHKNRPDLAIEAVRGFLAAKVRGTGGAVRGAAAIVRRFAMFFEQLPEMAKETEISAREVVTLGYVVEWLKFAAAWQSRTR
jgi:hypothetical protein